MSIKNLFTKFKKYNTVLNIINKNPGNFLNFSKYINNSRNTSKYTQILSNQKLQSDKKYSSDIIYTSDSDNEIDTDYIEETEFNNAVSTRQMLNTSLNDPIIAELNACASVQEVFAVIEKNDNKMEAIHISQTILVLWDLQKCFYKHNFFYQECNTNKLMKTNDLLRNYIMKVKTHDDFKKLLILVENNYQYFSMDALTCCLLYLNRMGVDLKHKVIQDMILKCVKDIDQQGVNFPLTALSRFAVAVYGEEDSYWSLSVSKSILPIILSHLDSCESAEKLKLITICLNKMNKIVTKSVLNKYKSVVERLIDEEKLTYLDQRCILKTFIFLNKPQWHEENNAIIKKLFYIFKKHVHKLTDREIIILFKVFQMKKEPADMLDEIQESASNRLSEKDMEEYPEITLDLLSCIVSFSSPLQRPKFEQLARQYIQNSITSSSLTSLYKILYHIKSSDITLCNTFWDKILTLVKKEDPKIRLNKLLNLCHKYMHFTKNGHHYRYYKFERAVIDLIRFELEFGIAGIIPCKFSRVAAFIIAYNDNPNILEAITTKIKEVNHQFSPLDCLNLAMGIHIASENLLLYKNLSSINKSLNEIVDILNNCIDRELLKSDLNTLKINIMLRGYTLRKGDVRSNRFNKMLDFYTKEKELSSNTLKDFSYMLQHYQFLAPNLIEKMIDYSISCSNSLLGNTVEKVLYLTYTLGYTPENVDDFLSLCSDLLIRDKERLNGLSFIQSSLALCYFNRLPEFLVKHIFSVEFLEKLDIELSQCYARAVYPVRVRDHLMQLNRAVCLDYMECDVPWFHQKYIEQLKNKSAVRNNPFHHRVRKTLLDTIKEEQITENVYTPYGYSIDFEINLEKEGHSNQSMPRKIAINILQPKAYTLINRNLKGYYQLKKRHLEILGYEVLYEDQQQWKELYSQEQCVSYMSEKIWPSSNNIKQNTVL